jgi:hypothetical protein
VQRIRARLDRRGGTLKNERPDGITAFGAQNFVTTPFKEGKRVDRNQSKKMTRVSLVKTLSAVAALEEDIKMNQSRRPQVVKSQPRRPFNQKSPREDNGGIKKEYLGSDAFCRVTLRLPKEAVGAAGSVAVVGDFNDWDQEAMPMKRLRSGDFEITIALPTGKEYRFRYLIDGSRWENDWCADKYYPNSYGCDDSVLII